MVDFLVLFLKYSDINMPRASSPTGAEPQMVTRGAKRSAVAATAAAAPKASGPGKPD